MIPLTQKQFLAIVGVVVALVVVIVVALLLRGDPTITIEKVSQAETKQNLVDFGSVSSNFSAEEKDTITQGLVDYIQPSNSKVDLGNNSIVAREGSYNKTLFEGKIPVVTTMFDVKELKSTYKLRWDGGEDYEFNILSVSCAEKSEQKDSTWECIDVGP